MYAICITRSTPVHSFFFLFIFFPSKWWIIDLKIHLWIETVSIHWRVFFYVSQSLLHKSCIRKFRKKKYWRKKKKENTHKVQHQYSQHLITKRKMYLKKQTILAWQLSNPFKSVYNFISRFASHSCSHILSNSYGRYMPFLLFPRSSLHTEYSKKQIQKRIAKYIYKKIFSQNVAGTNIWAVFIYWQFWLRCRR